MIYVFLRKTSLPSDSPPVIDGKSANLESLLKRESRQRKLLKVFWSVWLKDYIGDLSKFAAPGVAASELRRVPKVGELVLIHEDTQKRVMWPVGIVDELIVGKDGRTRAVWLKVARLDRINPPVQRLFPIEVQSGVDRDDELDKRRKAREEREAAQKRTKVLSKAADVVSIHPEPETVAEEQSVQPVRRNNHEAQTCASVPEDVESFGSIQALRSRRQRAIRLPRHFQDYRN